MLQNIKYQSMNIPKFLIGDNTDCPDDIFIIHTEFPRFIINLSNEDVEWMDDLEGDEEEIVSEVAQLVEQAAEFYDREIERYEDD